MSAMRKAVKKKRRMQDATLVNVRAAKKLMATLLTRVAKLETRVANLEDERWV